MNRKVKVHSLIGRIDDRMMKQAFRTVRRNRSAAAVDKVSIGMFETNLQENLEALKRDLKSGEFIPKPLRRKYFLKNTSSNKTPPLGIPVVRDRVAQEVLRRLLSPIFEPMFHDSSYGYRPGRNYHQAMEKVLELHAKGNQWVLDADIKGFFGNLPHRFIMQSIAWHIADGKVLNLIERFLAAEIMEDGVYKPNTIGTPQGGIISPLLTNIALNHLDWRLDKAGYRFVRFADDFVVICRSHREAQEARDLVQNVLEDDLELQLNSEKTHITTYGKGYKFLGFFLPSYSRRIREKSERKFKDKTR